VQSFKQRRLAVLATILAFGLIAAACGGDDNSSSSDEGGSGGSGSGSAKGEVNVSGSSTVLPISTAVGEAFQDDNKDATVNVDGPGTGDGFKLFCDGETDISDASRPIKDEEKAQCQQKGIEYVELPIGFDGITVMTGANNDKVTCLSFPDLYALIGPESNGFKKWSDGTKIASALGSKTSLPDETLDLTGPGTESGTYDSFIEIALTAIAEDRGLDEDKAATTRSDYDASPDDNVIVQNVEGSDSSLGWVGFAYAQQAGDKVKEIEIAKDANGKCVAPSAETIADGSYPLSRTLYIYVNKAKAKSNPAVSAFVDFYLKGLKGFVDDAGYVALPSDKAAASQSTWDGR
jgi:phosphate transport system substrate-binding protein